jgi:hypothetical protein
MQLSPAITQTFKTHRNKYASFQMGREGGGRVEARQKSFCRVCNNLRASNSNTVSSTRRSPRPGTTARGDFYYPYRMYMATLFMCLLLTSGRLQICLIPMTTQTRQWTRSLKPPEQTISSSTTT